MFSKPVSPQQNAATHYGRWLLLLFVCALVYWPGLKGPFLFDDFGTLADLGDLGGVKDWFTFKAYVFGGFTGPTGRPLSLLSFLIDGNNWPTEPWPFKRTNLVIHLVNGVLLGVLNFQVLRLINVDEDRARWLAFFGAACWLLHPFLVSTTLYVVQRMAQLSAMFVFLGMLFYLNGRSFLPHRPFKAYCTMSLALALCTLLAMISKENGVLLPLLVLTLEFTVVASQGQRLASLNKRWATLFLVVPSIVIVAYLGYQVSNLNFFEANMPRDFSIYERLLTESRIMLDYLKHWLIPSIYTTGVFQDHFLKSTGFFSPISTALSAAFHLLLVGICIVKRRKWPLFAFAVLFFYSGHLLESTVVNLELYFEHRNYLPAAFLFLPLLVLLRDRTSVPLFATAVLLLLFVLAGFTRYTASVWESYPKIVEASAKKAPTSARAQRQYSRLLFNSQQYDDALRVTDAAIERLPDDEKLHIWRSTMLCTIDRLESGDFEAMKRAVTAKKYDPRALGLYSTFVNAVIERKCRAISLDELKSVFTDMLNIPSNADPRLAMFSQIKYFVGMVDIYRQDPVDAMANFQESLQSRPGASHAMQMAALMASNGFYDEAMLLSETALLALDSGDIDLLASDPVKASDIEEFRENVRLEIRALSDKNGMDE